MKTCTPDGLPAPPEVRQAAAGFLQRLRQATGRAGRTVVLGSTARGEHGPDSDVDVWVDRDGDEHEAMAAIDRARRFLGAVESHLP